MLKNRMIKTTLLILMLVVALSACTANTNEQPSTTDSTESEVTTKAKTKQDDKQLSGEEELAHKVTDFSLQLLKQVSKERNDNILISGLSVMPALAMTQNGAEENTLQQMNDVLAMDNQTANDYFMAYSQQLAQEKNKKMYLANSIWIKDAESITVQPSFLETNKKYYNAEIEQLAFDDAALAKINSWVKENTNNMIDKLIDKISGDAIMYLVNAIYFESEWQNNYTPRSVTDKKFTLENGTEQDAKMMYSVEKYYLEDKDTLGVIKPYKGGKYQFIAIMPNKGIKMKDYLNSLTAEKIDSLLKNKHEADVYTTLPQFETEYDIELSAVLKALGMTDAFNPLKANFQSLASVQSAEEKIIISRVLHKTKLTLDEKGTKAAAATAVEMTKTTAMPPMYEKEKKEVNLNRPFVYMIYDSKNQVPVFIGTLMSIK